MICCAAALLFFSCLERDPLQPESGPDDLFQPRLDLLTDSLFTSIPCHVNFMFQLVDSKNHGCPNLGMDSLKFYEDNQPLSPSESQVKLTKRGTLEYQLRTVLMLDNSASVKNNLTAIKEAAIGLVRSRDKNQRIAIYSFSEHVILLQDFTDDTTKLIQAIRGLKEGQMSTDLYGAVITGTGRWKEEYNEKQVIDGFLLLLTDGADTQGRYTLGQALDACKNKKVLAVGVGNELDTKILSDIANCGFSKINDYAELPRKFSEFQTFMVDWANSFYWLIYKSPKRGDHYHTFKMFLWPAGSKKPLDSLSIPYNSANFISGN
jgi:hypothetical protein